MVRQYHKWFSENLCRDMEVLVFGHAGKKVIVFPTRQGRFYDYENFRVVDTLSDRIASGSLQLVCVDSVDSEAMYCSHRPPPDRARRHLDYESYILREVLPFAHSINPDARLVAHGCSFGAYHAVNIGLRHPESFTEIVAFSGRYDLTRRMGEFNGLFDEHYDENIYFLMPNHYMPNLTDTKLITVMRRMRIVIAIGAEDAFLESNHALCDALSARQIPHELRIWNGEAHRFRDWRAMATHYLI